jgi:hypothetical protein
MFVQNTVNSVACSLWNSLTPGGKYMAEPHCTGYVGIATGIVGSITGIAGEIMGYVSYRRSNNIKALDVRLEF